MKPHFIFVLFLATLLPSCQPTNALDQASWILGTWEQRTSRGSLYEQWKTRDAHAFQAISFFLKKGDTIILETVTLREEAGQLYYEPSVTNQNDGLSVQFTLQAISPNNMVFENPVHDFPQRIEYRRITQDSLVATISGMQDGRKESRDFPMRRVE